MAGTRKTAVAVVLAALALTATACNNDSGAKNAGSAAPTTAAAGTTAAAPEAAPAKVSPAVFLEQVGKKTGAAKSAKIDEEVTVGGISMKVDGALGWADGLQGEMTMDMAGLPGADKMAAGLGGTAFTYRFVNDGMYMKLGGQFAQVTDGRHWVHVGYDDISKLQGGANSADQLKKADPVEAVQALIASGGVTEVGKETVGGKPTTHYTGTLKVADLVAANGNKLSPEQVDRMKKSLSTAGVTSETIDVWVDADQLVVKQAGQADSKAGAMKFSVTYSDYGTPVAATAPDKSDTIEMAELAQLGKNAGAGN
ncbi:hypothetical protein AB0O91_03675 [Kitasatospora sp. NPDC089797]|uniref:hypothetical protein n=1 Tax=Kitasatospora sp. NPDC089797 TaxID=3155298 RepID=UPI00343DD92E